MRLSVVTPLHASWLVKKKNNWKRKLISLRVPLLPQGLPVTVNWPFYDRVTMTWLTGVIDW
jgi:hypothetical protein